MFTGIIQALGVYEKREGKALTFEVPLKGVKVGDSIAVEGVCLTVTQCRGREGEYSVDFDLSDETLDRTTLGGLQPGDAVNLEPALKAGDPLGGHFVQGHVDDKGTLLSKDVREGWTLYEFSTPAHLKKHLVEKGSVAVDGVSLTVVEVREASFTVAIIPFTEEHTSLGQKKIGQGINVESDVLSKYMSGLLRERKPDVPGDLFMKKKFTL